MGLHGSKSQFLGYTMPRSKTHRCLGQPMSLALVLKKQGRRRVPKRTALNSALAESVPTLSE